VRRAISDLIFRVARRDATSASRYRVLAGPLRGMSLELPLPERPSMLIGTYERHITRQMRRFLAPGDCFVDVGAHVGYMSLIAGRCIGRNGRIVCFEANPKLVQALRRNTAQSASGNVVIHQVAASEKPGSVTFATFSSCSTVGRVHDASTPDDAELVTVEARPLDALLDEPGFRPPRFVKIDVEGFELQVLRGARAMLSTYRPVVAAELRADDTLEPSLELMRSFDYEAQMLNDGRGNGRDGVIDVLFVGR
jgi:FkbM family methyltransferase